MTFARYQADLTPIRGDWASRGRGLTAPVTPELRARDAVLVGAVTRCGADALPRHGADVDLSATRPTPTRPIASGSRRRSTSGVGGTPRGWAHALSLTSAQIRGARSVAQYQWPRRPDGFHVAWSRLVYVWTGTLTVGPLSRWALGDARRVRVAPTPPSWWAISTVGPDVIVGVNMTPCATPEIRQALAKWKSAGTAYPALGIADGVIVGMPGPVVGGFVVGGLAHPHHVQRRGRRSRRRLHRRRHPAESPSAPWCPYVGRPPSV